MNSQNSIPLRTHLLIGALRFVQTASQLDGVLRVAMIGSMTTTKLCPKDIDFLIAVSDDADLSPLAVAGRRLKGHTQGQNAGADIFLCSAEGSYIGRICHWKNCQPGVRMSCDAQSCGQRPFLHDDFQDITLPQSLVAHPPLELWPTLVARVRVPADVEQWLVAPLGRA